MIPLLLVEDVDAAGGGLEVGEDGGGAPPWHAGPDAEGPYVGEDEGLVEGGRPGGVPRLHG